MLKSADFHVILDLAVPGSIELASGRMVPVRTPNGRETCAFYETKLNSRAA